jgi:hypothetical protein
MFGTVVQASHEFYFVGFSLFLRLGFPLSFFWNQIKNMQFLIIWSFPCSFWIMGIEKFFILLKIISL